MSTPKFSKRHYEVLANMLAVLRQSHSKVWDADVQAENVNAIFEDVGYGRALLDVEHDLIAVFANDNARFEADRFRDAAQPRNAKPFASALHSDAEVA